MGMRVSALPIAMVLMLAGTQAVAAPMDVQPLTDDLWALDRIDQAGLPLDHEYHHDPKGGEGVTVYVLDTGIRTTHRDFEGRAFVGADFTGPGPDDPGYCPDNDHGTSVASLVGGKTYGVAKAVKLVSVRVLTCDDFAVGVVDAIDWVIEHASRPSIMNLSFGKSSGNAAWDKAVERALAAGITVTVAAGNNGEDSCVSSPDRVTGAITVGGTDDEDNRWDWGPSGSSGFGKCIDLFAPAAFVVSAGATSDDATGGGAGNSAAAPLTAGAAALYLADHPDAKPSQVARYLICTSTKDVVKNAGDGSPNRLLFTGSRARRVSESACCSGDGDPVRIRR